MNDKPLKDIVVRRRVAVLEKQYPGREITFTAREKYGIIRVAMNDMPEHFELVLDESNFSIPSVKEEILILSRVAPITVLIPNLHELINKLYKANYLEESRGQVTTMAYDKDGNILEIRFR